MYSGFYGNILCLHIINFIFIPVFNFIYSNPSRMKIPNYFTNRFATNLLLSNMNNIMRILYPLNKINKHKSHWFWNWTSAEEILQFVSGNNYKCIVYITKYRPIVYMIYIYIYLCLITLTLMIFSTTFRDWVWTTYRTKDYVYIYIYIHSASSFICT